MSLLSSRWESDASWNICSTPYLKQSFKLCELCALDKSVEIHLLQDVEAGELLAPLVFVQSCEHPALLFAQVKSFQILVSAPASGLSSGSKYGANGGVLQGSKSLRVVDGSLVT